MMTSLRLVLKLLLGLVRHASAVLVLADVLGAEDASDVLLEVVVGGRVVECRVSFLWLRGILLVWGLSGLLEGVLSDRVLDSSGILASGGLSGGDFGGSVSKG